MVRLSGSSGYGSRAQDLFNDETKLTEALFEMMKDKNSHYPDEQMIAQGVTNNSMDSRQKFIQSRQSAGQKDQKSPLKYVF